MSTKNTKSARTSWQAVAVAVVVPVEVADSVPVDVADIVTVDDSVDDCDVVAVVDPVVLVVDW